MISRDLRDGLSGLNSETLSRIIDEACAELVIRNNVGNYVNDCAERDAEPNAAAQNLYPIDLTWATYGTASETAQAVLGGSFFEDVATIVRERQTGMSEEELNKRIADNK